MFDGKFRAPIDKAVKPVGDALRRTGLTPDHLTIAGLRRRRRRGRSPSAPATCCSGCCSWSSPPLPDLLDGALAKASDAASQRGAFFDSTVDRVTDAVLLGGVAWYLAGARVARTWRCCRSP